MSTSRWLIVSVFTLNTLPVAADVSAGDLLVTRRFTGLWDQVEQESQGISLQVVEHNGFGEFEFHSPMETGRNLLTFDPRGMQIEIHNKVKNRFSWPKFEILI